MRATRRFILGVLVFAAAAGVASAQQPKPQPSLPPLPKARVTPASQPPDTVPPTEQKSKTLVLVPIRTAPKKPAQATANKKPIEKPAAAEPSPSPSPGAEGAANVPAGTPSPVPSPTAAPADKKPAEASQGKTSVGNWIVLGIGGVALIGLVVYFVRSRGRADTLPPIFPDR